MVWWEVKLEANETGESFGSGHAVAIGGKLFGNSTMADNDARNGYSMEGVNKDGAALKVGGDKGI
jgi:hypothetical protein